MSRITNPLLLTQPNKEKIMNKTIKRVTAAALLVMPLMCQAAQHPKGLYADNRIRTITYDSNNVVVLNSHYGYQTDIVLGEDEEIENVAIGDALSWQAVPAKNHLFIKPMNDSTTNMALLTNKRSYTFQLKSSNNGNTPQTFKLQFFYPDEASRFEKSVVSEGKTLNPLNVNWKYSYKGDKALVPVQLFDNQTFTFFKFKEGGMTRLPAIFMVNPDRSETLVNYYIEKHNDERYVVVNRVARQFTLRDGQSRVCIFNEKVIQESKA